LLHFGSGNLRHASSEVNVTTVRFCLIRHGETAWNVEKRIQGQTDIPLNATGRRQAQAMAEAIAGEPFSATYSSDLLRARETAAAAGQRLHLPVRLRAGLRERHFGIFQELTAAEAAARHADAFARHTLRDPEFDYQHGESLNAFSLRVERELRELAGAHPEQQVLVVTHGGVLDIVYRLATGRDLSAPRDFLIPNTGLNWVDWTGESWRIELWGDTEHLEKLGSRDELH
jgi:probable phosphoglycerate mutase